MEWMLLPLKRYAEFSGRSRRMEYWMFVLGQIVAYVVLGILFAILGGFSGGFGSGDAIGPIAIVIGIIFAIIALGLIIPNIAVQVRRLHDQNLTGWLVLIGYIPIINYIGGIVLFVFMLLPGTAGPNRFGPDPKETDVGEVFR